MLGFRVSRVGALTEDFRQGFRAPPGGHHLGVFWTSSCRVNLAVLQTAGALVWSRWVLLRGAQCSVPEEQGLKVRIRGTLVHVFQQGFTFTSQWLLQGKEKEKGMENKRCVMPDPPPPFCRLQPSPFHCCGTNYNTRFIRVLFQRLTGT